MADNDDWNAGGVKEFRANGGAVGGDSEGMPLLILHNTGTKSGKASVQPLLYQAVGDSFAIFASRGCAQASRLVPQPGRQSGGVH